MDATVARAALFKAAKLASATMPLNYKGETDRCFVMTAESAILDLLKCLEQNPSSKKEKRLNRIGFLMMYYGDHVKASTIACLGSILNKLKLVDAQEVAAVQSLEKLIAELQRGDTEDDGSIVFAKANPDAKFVVPLKQSFNDACKDIVNHDGYVYDVFTAVAVIAFEELLWGAEMFSGLRHHLLESSKLVFKGGASIGKHLFMHDKKRWDAMPEQDRQFVLDYFVNKGDNDTGLCFDKTAALNGPYTLEQMNNEIGAIAYDLQVIVLKTVKKFNVEAIIEPYMSLPEGKTATFAERAFALMRRKTSNFLIVDRNAQQKEILFAGVDDKSYLFGSTSYLEFASPTGELVKFHLARVKAAYEAKIIGNEDISVNCYAECLDISVPLLDSSDIEVEYQKVDTWAIL